MNYEKNEIPLGGNALAVTAFSEYTTAFMDNQYVELAEKLGNGIISMQQADGHFTHILNTDFSEKEDYWTNIYDGEAILALCKLYGITKNEKYLNSAEKALQNCIKNDYSIHCDHWISYAINEISKYVDNTEYYELGLKNFTRNINNIDNEKTSYSTALELLMQCLQLYENISEKQTQKDILKEFPIAKLTSIIQEKANSMLNMYAYPEIAMYLKNPSKYCNVFFVRSDSFSMRIDDIQHAILAYTYFKGFLQ